MVGKDHVNWELSARLEVMLEQEYLAGVNDAARGIARKVIEEGTNGPSDKQQWIYGIEFQEYLGVRCACVRPHHAHARSIMVLAGCQQAELRR